jgi:hypothetical protein
VLTITQVNYIRKLYYDKGKSVSEIENATGHNYRTIKKYIDCDDFNEIKSKKFIDTKSDLIRPFVREVLISDKNHRKKHRHTAKRIYERALNEHPDLCLIAERTMRDLVKNERLKIYDHKECFLDLEHPGGEAQVDFGEIYINKNETSVKAHELVLTFPASNVGYCQITYSETMEALLESLQTMFIHTGVVPTKIWFDQMSSACIRTKDKYGDAIPTERFLRFATHYGFEPVFCNPNSGNEKGNVENKVGYFRNNIFIPFIKCNDLKSTNKDILSTCDTDNLKDHYKHQVPQIELFEQEKSLMHTITKVSFDTAKYEKRRVNKYGHIAFDKCMYSVSPRYVNEYVWVKIMANSLSILTETYSEITKHKRSFSKGKTYTNWIDFIEIIVQRPKALKYSNFYKTLPEAWTLYTESLDKPTLKSALTFLKHCLIEADIKFAEKVLVTNLEQNVCDPKALWTTYYRLKENVQIYNYQTRKDLLPAMPQYKITLSDYDSLIGGDRL